MINTCNAHLETMNNALSVIAAQIRGTHETVSYLPNPARVRMKARSMSYTWHILNFPQLATTDKLTELWLSLGLRARNAQAAILALTAPHRPDPVPDAPGGSTVIGAGHRVMGPPFPSRANLPLPEWPATDSAGAADNLAAAAAAANAADVAPTTARKKFGLAPPTRSRPAARRRMPDDVYDFEDGDDDGGGGGLASVRKVARSAARTAPRQSAGFSAANSDNAGGLNTVTPARGRAGLRDSEAARAGTRSSSRPRGAGVRG
jgi:hypothetical protein